MQETWYILETGEVGDPREIRPGADGKLRHKDGRAVAYAPHGPRSRSIDPAAMRAKAVVAGEISADEARKEAGMEPIAPTSRDMVAAAEKPPADDREMKPAASGGKGYRTRGATKAD